MRRSLFHHIDPGLALVVGLAVAVLVASFLIERPDRVRGVRDPGVNVSELGRRHTNAELEALEVADATPPLHTPRSAGTNR